MPMSKMLSYCGFQLNSKKKQLQNSFIILFCLSLFGCDALLNANNQSDGVIYCSEGNPTSFNPQLDTSGTTVDASSHQIYDRLLDFDGQTGNVIAGLATSWLISDNGLRYTFQLRKNVEFHQTDYFTPTRTFNVDDVIFSFDRWRLKDSVYHNVSGGAYPYADSLGLGKLIERVERINTYRLEIVLKQPQSSFLANLATDFAVILSKEYAEQLEQSDHKDMIDRQPIGTGPFKFANFRQDSFIRFKKHNQYWGDSIQTEQLIFDITPSSSLRLAKLITGECDAMGLPAHSELEVVRQSKDLILDEKPGLNVGFWAFNTSKPPFDRPEVRRALSLAIDKNALIEAIYFDSAILAKNIVPPTSWAFQTEQKNISYNPSAAKKLLRENGIEPGFTMTIWAMPVERPYNPNAIKMAELMQGYLQAVGVNVEIVSYEWSTFREKLKQGIHDSVLIGWSADNGDPDNFYRPLLSCAAIKSGTNRAFWCSEEYDGLIDQALRFTNNEDRQYFYFKANALIAEQLPLVPIAHASKYQAFRKNLVGFEINPYGGVKLAGVTKD
jgi:cationic peptide transport system substrate-binding protein